MTPTIVFFGTPDFAVASLRALVEGAFPVVAVVTATDKPAGRGHHVQPPPVKVYAETQGIPVLQPANLKDEAFLAQLRAYNADLHIVVAFRMLPEAVWNMPVMGTYNVHASLLPDYRGAAPINWAIINGERETGVTTFKLQHEIDTGNILLQRKVAISDDDNAGTLHDKLMVAGAALLVESVKALSEGPPMLNPQPAHPAPRKHAPKIFKDDCRISWAQPANSVRNFIRGMAPFPGAHTEVTFEDGTRGTWKITASQITNEPTTVAGQVRISHDSLFASCADLWLEITELQVPGKKPSSAAEFLRGFRKAISGLQLR